MPHIPSAGKKEEKAEFESAHESSLIKAITSVRRKIATFCEFSSFPKINSNFICHWCKKE